MGRKKLIETLAKSEKIEDKEFLREIVENTLTNHREIIKIVLAKKNGNTYFFVKPKNLIWATPPGLIVFKEIKNNNIYFNIAIKTHPLAPRRIESFRVPLEILFYSVHNIAFYTRASFYEERNVMKLEKIKTLQKEIISIEKEIGSSAKKLEEKIIQQNKLFQTKTEKRVLTK